MNGSYAASLINFRLLREWHINSSTATAEGVLEGSKHAAANLKDPRAIIGRTELWPHLCSDQTVSCSTAAKNQGTFYGMSRKSKGKETVSCVFRVL